MPPNFSKDKLFRCSFEGYIWNQNIIILNISWGVLGLAGLNRTLSIVTASLPWKHEQIVIQLRTCANKIFVNIAKNGFKNSCMLDLIFLIYSYFNSSCNLCLLRRRLWRKKYPVANRDQILINDLNCITLHQGSFYLIEANANCPNLKITCFSAFEICIILTWNIVNNKL